VCGSRLACGSAGATLNAFWTIRYQPDDLRRGDKLPGSKWRPGDVVLLNAGYAYPALLTYGRDR